MRLYNVIHIKGRILIPYMAVYLLPAQYLTRMLCHTKQNIKFRPSYFISNV